MYRQQSRMYRLQVKCSLFLFSIIHFSLLFLSILANMLLVKILYNEALEISDFYMWRVQSWPFRREYISCLVETNRGKKNFQQSKVFLNEMSHYHTAKPIGTGMGDSLSITGKEDTNDER